MYLYIVDFWIPFPSSEYGGVGIVLANNDKEAFKLLKDSYQYSEEYGEYDDDLKEVLSEAIVYPIEGISESSRVVKTFYT